VLKQVRLKHFSLGITQRVRVRTAGLTERLLLAVVGLSGVLNGFVLTHKSVGAMVSAAVGLAALLGAGAIGGRRWWRDRKDPSRPDGPNYNRAPYV
jgi:hypothetical protein